MKVSDADYDDNNDNTQDDNYCDTTYGAKPYVRVRFGSSNRQSVSARWLPTRRPSCSLDI